MLVTVDGGAEVRYDVRRCDVSQHAADDVV